MWRPTIVYVAGEAKSTAIEKVTQSLTDMMFTYLSGRGWSVKPMAVAAPRVINVLFSVYSAVEPTELGREPTTPKELEDALKNLEDVRRKESSPTLNNRPIDAIPTNLRNPSSEGAPMDASTEESRRHVIFANPNLSKEQARLAFAEGAGIVYGDAAKRATDAVLWLFDIERIEREGLSEQAERALATLGDAAKSVVSRRAKKQYPNACLIGRPQWSGTPRMWSCSLPPTQDGADCYCPPPPDTVGNWLEGRPVTLKRGMVCALPQGAVCPMVESAPEGSLCRCGGLAAVQGQVR